MTSSNQPESASAAKKSMRAAAVAHRAATKVDSARVCGSLELFLVQKTGGSGGFVVVYDALEGEVDLSSIWANQRTQNEATDSSASTAPAGTALASTVSYAITRTPKVDMNLTVHPVTTELELHRWGYRQPVEGSVEIDLVNITAVLVPGLAFDLQGGRLGWGAGYYDRFLSRLAPAVLKIGVSDGYIVEQVPTDDHDVAMTHIATPSGVLSV